MAGFSNGKYVASEHDLEFNSTTKVEHEKADSICSFEMNAHQSEQSPVEQVALTVPTTDDPAMPSLTFRVWVLGTISCVSLMFLNTFFQYRTQPLTISGISAQIVTLPLGHFMAATIPKTVFRVPGLGWSFTFNPGPFSIKEHVLITVFANAGDAFGGGDAHTIGSINIIKAYYKRHISFFAALLVAISTRVMGYGWAGPLRKYLVEPAHMWWPSNLVQVSFRALHEKEVGKKGVKRIQFFLMVMAASFLYYTLPGYLFTILTFFSWVCWVWPHSVKAHQLGSGFHGLGIGAFSFDWAGIASYLGSPLVTPWFSIVNIGIGFVFFTYIVVPTTYWSNLYHAQTFPIFSNKLFTSEGKRYNITRVMTSNFELDKHAYQKYSKLYMSTFFALSTGVGFARIAATLTHVILFHGREIWKRSKNVNDEKEDIHTRLMRKYPNVPVWWFFLLLAWSVLMALLVFTVWNYQFQLPWWGILFACSFACLLTLPIGVITATTNQQPGFNVVSST